MNGPPEVPSQSWQRICIGGERITCSSRCDQHVATGANLNLNSGNRSYELDKVLEAQFSLVKEAP